MSIITSKLIRVLITTAVLVVFSVSAVSSPAPQAPNTTEQGATTELAKANSLDLEIVRLYKEGKYSEAVPLAKQVIKIREKLLPRDNPLLADALTNLALLYVAQTKLDDAESALKRAIAVYEKDAKANQLVLARIFEGLAYIRLNKGDVIKAADFYQRAASMKEAVLGESHDDTIYSINSLAEFYARQKDFPKAKATLQRLITIKQKQFGASHAEVARLKERLACLLHRNNEKGEAEIVEAQANSILYREMIKRGNTVPLPDEIFACKLIVNPRPSLASIARNRRLNGVMNLAVEVEADGAGNVITARYVGKDSGFKSVTEKAAREAKLRPTLVDGQPVKVKGVITHVFSVVTGTVLVPGVVPSRPY